MAGSMAETSRSSGTKRSDLFEGQIFKTFEELNNAVRDYGRENHTLFVKENSRKSKFKDNEYDYINLVCKQGGRKRKSSSKGIRANLGTVKCGCPVTVRASTVQCPTSGKIVYKLKKVMLEHNHEVSELTFKAYTQNRRPEMTESLQSLLACKSVSNLDIRLYIEQTQGKTILNSDLRNLKLKQNVKKTKTSDVSHVKQFIDLCIAGGGDVDYDLNEESGSFEYLVYMSQSMKMLLSQFPEILFIDASYESNQGLLPLLTIMCIDNAGAVHPVLHAFVQCIGEKLISKCFQFLSARYESNSTQTFFVGRDFSEASAIKTVFPHSDVLLDHSYIKLAVRNSLQLKGVPADRVKVLLGLFEKQMAAATEEEYQQLGAEIKTLVSSHIADYFESHWWNCPQLWASYINLDMPELHASTTNRMESYHRKIKSILHSKLGLGEALELLAKYDNHLLQSAATRTAVEAMKSHYNSKDNDSVVDEIYNDVTSFAAKLVVAQYKLAKNFDYVISVLSDDVYEIKSSDDLSHSTSLNFCSCKFFTNLKLQCMHMFALRRYLNILPLYQRVSDQHRFSRKLLVPLLSSQQDPITISGEDGNDKVLSVQENYLAAERLLKDLSSYLFCLDAHSFKSKTEQLQMLLTHWKSNGEVEFSIEASKSTGEDALAVTSMEEDVKLAVSTTEAMTLPPSDSSTVAVAVPPSDSSTVAVAVSQSSDLVFPADLPTDTEENVKKVFNLGTARHVQVKIESQVPQIKQNVTGRKRKRSNFDRN